MSAPKIGESCAEFEERLRDLRSRAVALYVPPFRYAHGYVYDSRGHMVADQGGSEEPSSLGLRVRGWGRIGGMPESAAIQDEAGKLMAELLTAHWPVLVGPSGGPYVRQSSSDPGDNACGRCGATPSRCTCLKPAEND